MYRIPDSALEIRLRELRRARKEDVDSSPGRSARKESPFIPAALIAAELSGTLLTYPRTALFALTLMRTKAPIVSTTVGRINKNVRNRA
jgi:hypothetical protein